MSFFEFSYKLYTQAWKAECENANAKKTDRNRMGSSSNQPQQQQQQKLQTLRKHNSNTIRICAQLVVSIVLEKNSKKEIRHSTAIQPHYHWFRFCYWHSFTHSHSDRERERESLEMAEIANFQMFRGSRRYNTEREQVPVLKLSHLLHTMCRSNSFLPCSVRKQKRSASLLSAYFAANFVRLSIKRIHCWCCAFDVDDEKYP